jgi:ArsR family transcriptional regulator, arsenate/arsenite/antimonite-responsive transcriptional repressor
MRKLASVFKALSDETRLQMLGLLLRQGELCVCDFVEVLSVTQSKASRHLRYLVNAGLIQDRRAGIWVYFRIAEEPGPVESAVLDSLRKILPGQVPADLVSALMSWRKRKPKGGLACATARPRRRA